MILGAAIAIGCVAVIAVEVLASRRCASVSDAGRCMLDPKHSGHHAIIFRNPSRIFTWENSSGNGNS
jgi:hypothetical protein